MSNKELLVTGERLMGVAWPELSKAPKLVLEPSENVSVPATTQLNSMKVRPEASDMKESAYSSAFGLSKSTTEDMV